MPDLTLDGSYGTDPIIILNEVNDTSETNTVTVTEGFGGADGYAGYLIYSDTADGGYEDTWNFVLPKGWTYFTETAGTYNGSDIIGIGFITDSYEFSGFVFTLGEFGDISNVCLTRGAMVDTPDGPRAVEDLSEGDLVMTRDHGPQPIRWVGSSKVTAETLDAFPHMRPVRIAAGALGDHGETVVSPAHRMLVTGWRAEALYGETEVLASARSLINDSTIRVDDAREVEYFHILFDRHEIICADGAWSESFHPAAMEMGDAAAATRDEVIEIFPELETDTANFGATARRTISASDVSILMG